MDWIEVTARSIADAKELALDRLGVVEDELEFEVLDEPRKGMFGLGRAEARIRARVKPISREKPADRRRRRTNSRERSNRGGSGGGGRSTKPDKPQKPARPDQAANVPATAGATGDGEPSTRSSSGNRRRRGGRGRGKSQGGNSGAQRAVPTGEVESGEGASAPAEKAAEVEVETLPIEEQAEHAAAFAQDLVRTMGFTATVRTEIDEDDLTVHVDGQNLGALVGPRGATLQALEEVVKAVVQHHAGGHSAWVHVDVGGYKARRREALEDFARKMAAEVKDTGAARQLEPMSPADRKIVHDAVGEIDGVVTASEGEDQRRRVVIRPA
jgi:spoIIIJ-associated protein